jgi:hypothetical protein
MQKKTKSKHTEIYYTRDGIRYRRVPPLFVEEEDEQQETDNDAV